VAEWYGVITLGSIIAEWTLNLVTGDIRICCVFLV